MAAFGVFGSGVPARVLCLEAGTDFWADVSAVVLAHLQHAFARGKPLTRLPLGDGRWHVFDFAHMLRYDEAVPGAPNAAPLAWYDEAGNAFFPHDKAHLHVQPSEGFRVDEQEAITIVRRWTMDTAAVTRAERCDIEDVRLRIFRDKERSVGGNFKLCWYGASPADVKMAAGKTLFRSTNWSLIGSHRAHGRGLHLSPLRFPHLSMSIAEADDSGEASVLLCRIVQGLPVAIRAGSNQCTNTRHDLKSTGGVDYLPNPSWYVVWAEHMNVSVVPLCVVSFVKRPVLQVLGPLITCTPVFLDMRKLRREIKRFLPSSQLQDLDRYFDSNTGSAYNFSKCVSELIGLDMFVGAVLKSLEL
ncbi:unnamed protein product [Alopecurus aequalis]